MPRMPNCQYLTQTKSPDINSGVAEYKCSMFNWTDASFIKSTKESSLFDMDVLVRNTELFKQCRNCPHKQEGA